MWSVRSETVEASVSVTRWGVRWQPSEPARWSSATDSDEAIRALGTALQGRAGRGTVRVWLGNALARPFIVPAAHGAGSQAELEALAAVRASSVYGSTIAWRIWADKCRDDRPVLCVALDARVYEALEAAGRGSQRSRPRWRLGSMRPSWNLLLDEIVAQSKRDHTRLGWSLADDDGLVHGVVDKGRCTDVGYLPAPMVADRRAALRRRLQMSWGMVDAVVDRLVSFEEAKGPGSWPMGNAIEVTGHPGEAS